MNIVSDKMKLVAENWPVVRDELKKAAIESINNGGNRALKIECKTFSCGFVSGYLHEPFEKDIGQSEPTVKQEMLEFLKHELSNVDLTAGVKTEPVDIESIEKQIQKLPKEWNVIQIGRLSKSYAGYATQEDNSTMEAPIKFTLLRYNLSETLGNRALDVILELKEHGSKSIPSTAFEIQQQYKLYKLQMKSTSWTPFIKNLTELQAKIIKDMNFWLGPWIVLFAGKCKNVAGISLENQIFDKVDKLAMELGQFPHEHIALLKLIARRIDLLDVNQIEEAASQLAQNLVQVKRIQQFLAQLKMDTVVTPMDYYPCILIIDEILEPLPWEMILTKQEFTRFNSIYLLLHLYNLYKDQIKDGYLRYKVTRGAAILNPDNDSKLDDMVKRIDDFYKKWRPDWRRIVSRKPTNDELNSMYKDYDVLVYSGHGSGLQMFKSTDEIKLKTKSVLMLMGCESIALKYRGLVSEAYGPPYVYFTTECPVLIGANTLISDLWSDTITFIVLMQWIPSEYNELPHIDKVSDQSTSKRVEKILKDAHANRPNPNLLSIISKIRQYAELSVRMQSAIIYRGLPIYNDLMDENVKMAPAATNSKSKKKTHNNP